MAGEKLYSNRRFAIFLLLLCALLIARRLDVITNPQFYAEDGSVFFREQAISPWTAVFLPYNGYLHAVPRLIALLETFVPLAIAPLLCGLAAIVVQAASIAVFVLPWNRYLIRSDLLRAAACVVMATAVDGHELVGFTGPLMWFLFVAGVLLLFRPEDPARGERSWPAIARLAIMVLIGLTSAPMLVLAPILLWRIARKRGEHRVLAAALLAALAVQVCVLVVSPRTDTPPGVVGGVPLLASQVGTAVIVSWLYAGVITPLFGLGAATVVSRWPTIGPPLFALIAVTAALTWLLTVSESRRRWQIAFGLYIVASCVSLSLYTRNLVWLSQNLTGTVMLTTPRYFVLASAVLIFLGCLLIERIPLPAHWRALCLLALFLMGIRGNFSVPAYPDLHWAANYPKIEEWKRVHRPTVVNIVPPPWVISLP